MLKLNSKLIAKQNSAKKRVMPSFERSGKFDEREVLIITAQSNTCKLPKGKSQEKLNAKEGDAIRIVANYYDPNFTLEVATANYSQDVVNVLPTYTGAEILEAVQKGNFAPNLDNDARAEECANIKETFIMKEEYIVPSLIYVKDLPEITLAQYKTLTKSEREDYHRKNDNIVKYSALGKNGIFTSIQYTELGGDLNAYADETFETILTEEEIAEAKEKFTRYIVYIIGEEFIEVETGETAFLLHSPEALASNSRKGQERKGQERNVVVNTKVTTNDEDLDEEELEDEL